MKEFLVAVVLLILVAGCGGKKTTGPGQNPGPTYSVPSSPYLVLDNLALAYSSRDSTKYKALFDDNYVGTSFDNASPGAGLDTFHQFDEARHISALARSRTISVSLDLTPNFTRSRDAGDPAGWALIQNPVYRLEIDDGNTQYVIPVTNETIEFRFIPTLDSASPTDTTWKIIRWTEIRN